ncbi:MAG: RNA polymerase sigma factor [Acidimicrobiales bacterium]
MGETSIDQAYRHHGKSVRSFALRLVDDRVSADDVAQEVFVRMLQSPDRFDGDRGTLRGFLMTQTRCRAMDHLRAEAARARRQRRVVAGTPCSTGDVEQEACDADQARRVREALAGLPAPERQAIAMAFFGGLSYREVARRLGEPEGTVKSRIRAGLRRLAVSLGQPDHDRTA